MMMPCKMHHCNAGLYGVTLFHLCPKAWPKFPQPVPLAPTGPTSVTPVTADYAPSSAARHDKMYLLRFAEFCRRAVTVPSRQLL